MTLIVGVQWAGGFSAVIENARQIPGFLDFFTMASPVVEDGVQVVKDGAPVFGEAAKYGLLTIVSTMSWGLGYFGMPQVLLKFMGIRKASELKLSRRVASVWCAISLFAAVLIGIIGRAMFPTDLLTKSSAESIFVQMSTSFFLPLFAGVVMQVFLRLPSSSDSYLLIASSAFSKNIYKGILKKDASDKTVLWMSKITLLVISVIAAIIALNENSIIFKIVSFAWAGFGATFGPSVIFSLFWKRTTRAGVVAGMLAGGISVFAWKFLIAPLGGVFGIYELMPSFIISCIFIVVVSLLTKAPSKDIVEEFEKVKNYVEA